MTFEDDVLFKDMGRLEAALKELPADWDIFYLGANITDMVFGIKENPPVRYSEHLYRVRKAWTTHAIGYSRKIVEKIVAQYPVHTYEMFDNWLNSEILPVCKAYLINPMVCWQRPGKSDLWGQETDYTGAFIHGDKIMNV